MAWWALASCLQHPNSKHPWLLYSDQRNRWVWMTMPVGQQKVLHHQPCDPKLGVRSLGWSPFCPAPCMNSCTPHPTCLGCCSLSSFALGMYNMRSGILKLGSRVPVEIPVAKGHPPSQPPSYQPGLYQFYMFHVQDSKEDSFGERQQQ